MKHSPSIEETLVLVPARMASTRLPGKPLADIAGLPMIVQVVNRAREAAIGRVVVATDDERVRAEVERHGGEAVMTDINHQSGSDRIWEAVTLLDPDGKYKFIVNVQGDLPTIDPLAIQRCLAGLVNEPADISTIAARIEDDADVANPNIVKAISPLSDTREVAFARDFVRRVGAEHEPPYWHHIGVYAYRRPVLERFVTLPVSSREADRKLEQMRAMDNGMKIVVVRVDTVPLGVDTPEDLEIARRMLRKT